MVKKSIYRSRYGRPGIMILKLSVIKSKVKKLITCIITPWSRGWSNMHPSGNTVPAHGMKTGRMLECLWNGWGNKKDAVHEETVCFNPPIRLRRPRVLTRATHVGEARVGQGRSYADNGNQANPVTIVQFSV